MNLVKVFNDNIYPLKELFKGADVIIKEKDYWRNADGSVKELDIFEASEFKGQYHPAPIDTDGKMVRDAQYFKKIIIEPILKNKPEAPPAKQGIKCMVSGCGHFSPSPEELEAHNKVRHANLPVSEGTADGPLTMNPMANQTRPIFEQNQASLGKEEAPSVRKKI